MRNLAAGLALALAAAPVMAAWSRTAYADGPSAEDKTKAKAFFKKGKQHQDAGEWDLAIGQYQQAYALAPFAEILFNIGVCYKEKGDRKNAIDYLRRYLDAAPDGVASNEAREFLDALVREEEKERAKLEDEERKRREAAAADEERKRKEAEAARAEEERKRKEAEEAKAKEERRRKAAEAKLRPEDRPVEGPRTEKRGGEKQRGFGAALMGLGVVATGLGIYYGLEAQKIGEEVSEAEGAWTDDLEARSAEGESAESKMFIFYGVGAALLVGGGVLYGLGVKAETTVVITPDTAMIGLGGHF